MKQFQPVRGTGEYFSGVGEYFAGLGSPDGLGSVQAVSGLGMFPMAAQAGVGATPATFNPIFPLASLLTKKKSMSGLGEDAPATTSTPPASYMNGTGWGVLIAAVVLGYGVAGYLAGRGMAPSKEKRLKYGLWGSAATITLGPVGLAIEGVIAANQKK